MSISIPMPINDDDDDNTKQINNAYLNTVTTIKPLKYLALFAVICLLIVISYDYTNYPSMSTSREPLSNLNKDNVNKQLAVNASEDIGAKIDHRFMLKLHDIEGFHNQYQQRLLLKDQRYHRCLVINNYYANKYATKHNALRSSQSKFLKEDRIRIARGCKKDINDHINQVKNELSAMIGFANENDNDADQDKIKYDIDGDKVDNDLDVDMLREYWNIQNYDQEIKNQIITWMNTIIEPNVIIQWKGQPIQHTFNLKIRQNVELYKKSLIKPDFSTLNFDDLFTKRNTLSEDYGFVIELAYNDTLDAFYAAKDVKNEKKKRDNVKAQYLKDNYPQYLEKRIVSEGVINSYVDLKEELIRKSDEILMMNTPRGPGKTETGRLTEILNKSPTAKRYWMKMCQVTNMENTMAIVEILESTKGFMKYIILPLHSNLREKYEKKVRNTHVPDLTEEEKEQMRRSCLKGYEGCMDKVVYFLTALIYAPQFVIIHIVMPLNPIVAAYGFLHLQYITTAMFYVPVRYMQFHLEGSYNARDRVYNNTETFVSEKIGHAFTADTYLDVLSLGYKYDDGKFLYFQPWEKRKLKDIEETNDLNMYFKLELDPKYH